MIIRPRRSLITRRLLLLAALLLSLIAPSSWANLAMAPTTSGGGATLLTGGGVQLTGGGVNLSE
jgi:hypothetical protein